MVRSPSSLLSLEQIVQLTAGTQVQAASVNAFAISTSKVSVRGAFVASARNCRRFLSSHSERTQKITIREKKTQFEIKKSTIPDMSFGVMSRLIKQNCGFRSRIVTSIVVIFPKLFNVTILVTNITTREYVMFCFCHDS